MLFTHGGKSFNLITRNKETITFTLQDDGKLKGDFGYGDHAGYFIYGLDLERNFHGKWEGISWEDNDRFNMATLEKYCEINQKGIYIGKGSDRFFYEWERCVFEGDGKSFSLENDGKDQLEFTIVEE
jgi:hypothetical protein